MTIATESILQEPQTAGERQVNTLSCPSDRSWIGTVATIIALLSGVIVLLAYRDQLQDQDGVPAEEDVTIEQSSATVSSSLSDDVVPDPVLPSATWPEDAPPLVVAPLDAGIAAELQGRWAEYLGIEAEMTNSVGMRLILIPPGEFLMGARQSDVDLALPGFDANDAHWMACAKSALPRHQVRVTRPFYMSRSEVTQSEYQQVTGKNPSYYSAGGKEAAYVQQVQGMDTSDHPVEGVSWFDCLEFCNRLSEREGRYNAYQPKVAESAGGSSPEVARRPASHALYQPGYRLPSEAQWEMACRGGTETRFWSGENPPEGEDPGWHGKAYASRSHRVGEKSPNPFGLYDMNDNVWEWVQDRFDPDYYQSVSGSESIDPEGPSKPATLHIVRGGLWPNSATASCERYAYESLYECNYVGFRVIIPLPDARQ
ncbi:MAG: formylglycine-generating enzyme family protein [Planctomyces sp.]|jgi:formylglycine-generating enzyme required for sulfatase activity